MDKVKVEKMIIETLKQNPYGLTISEMSRILKINRVTLSKYLDVLREKGLIDYRTIGRAKVWFINEDINILEAIFGEKELPRLLRKDEKGFYSLGDVKFFILPSEIIQDMYLIFAKRHGLNYIRDLGKRLGQHIGNTYKMYSGTEKVYNEEVLSYLLDFISKLGFGKIIDKYIDLKNTEIIVTFEETLEYEELDNIKDSIRDLKNNPRCYFTEGLLEGLISTVTNLEFEAKEIKCKLKGDKYCEFLIKEKR